MYSYIEKTTLAKKLANPHFIPTYRRLLESYRDSSATKISVNEKQLAEDLVYSLLGYMTEDEIFAATTGHRSAPVREAAPLSETLKPATAAVKKKFQNLRSILTSTGKTSITQSSEPQTASSRIASTCGAVFERLKTFCTKKRQTPTS